MSIRQERARTIASVIGLAVLLMLLVPATAFADGIEGVADGVGDTVDETGQTVGDTVDEAAQTVGDTVDETGQTVGDTVDEAEQTVGDTVDQADQTVGDTVDEAGQSVGDTVDEAGQTVGDTVNEAGQSVGDTVDQAGQSVGDTVDQAGQSAGDGSSRVTDADTSVSGHVSGGQQGATANSTDDPVYRSQRQPQPDVRMTSASMSEGTLMAGPGTGDDAEADVDPCETNPQLVCLGVLFGIGEFADTGAVVLGAIVRTGVGVIGLLVLMVVLGVVGAATLAAGSDRIALVPRRAE